MNSIICFFYQTHAIVKIMSDVQTTEKFIEQKLSTGKYADREELYLDAVRLMQARELALDEVAAELRDPVERMKRGEPAEEVDPESFISEETARHNAKTNRA